MKDPNQISEELSSLEDLQREVDWYIQLHQAARDRAVFLPPTPDEQRQIDENRRRISDLIDRIVALKLKRRHIQ